MICPSLIYGCWDPLHFIQLEFSEKQECKITALPRSHLQKTWVHIVRRVNRLLWSNNYHHIWYTSIGANSSEVVHKDRDRTYIVLDTVQLTLDIRRTTSNKCIIFTNEVEQSTHLTRRKKMLAWRSWLLTDQDSQGQSCNWVKQELWIKTTNNYSGIAKVN